MICRSLRQTLRFLLADVLAALTFPLARLLLALRRLSVSWRPFSFALRTSKERDGDELSAPTLAKVADSEVVWGDKRTVQYTYTGVNPYTSGGDTPSVPLRNIAGVICIGQNTASFGKEFFWNSQTGKMQIQVSSTGNEFSGDASTYQLTLLFISGDN